LLPLKPVFEQLGIIPRVIASGDPAELGFSVEFRPWRLETEIQELQQVGIGIAPLPDTPWERGKCGVKLLQYMACGIPVVASAVGVHREIIRHGENGLLAESDTEWRESLNTLLHQPALREKLGCAGRRTVEQHYDIPVAAQKMVVVLKAAVGQT
jgi:glycosyltransferase involved in cell wall biosynthesis